MLLGRKTLVVCSFFFLKTTLGQDALKPALLSGQAKSIAFAASVEVLPYAQLGLTEDYQYNTKDNVFDGKVLSANVIEFSAGSRLAISAASGDRRSVYIIAKTVRIADGEKAEIVWSHDSSIPRPDQLRRKAAPGNPGAAEGADGGPGEDGQVGLTGYSGRSAPTIYLFASKVEGGQLVVDLRGQDGGPGGDGQEGGDGGAGRKGRQAISSILDCRSGGGNGGNGGRGGDGGLGGIGGRGGNGGTFVFLTSEASLSASASHFLVFAGPGTGGKEGKPGTGGQKGFHGDGGDGSGFCHGGQPGGDGHDGNTPNRVGDGTRNGPSGVDGTFAISALTKEALRALHLENE